MLLGRHFDTTAEQWRDLYSRKDVYAKMYQHRREVVLAMADRLALPNGSDVLEVGCGPGITSVDLARRGYAVTALDVAPGMIELTRRLASASGVEVRCLLGDVRHLPLSDGAFRLVLAVGVTEWMDNLEPAIAELARVIAPGGHLILTTDNRWALYRLLDPALNPALDSLKRLLRRSKSQARPTVFSRAKFDRAIEQAGLRVVEGRTLGFGPFSFFKCPLFSDSFAIRLHRRLQLAADRGMPWVRGAGHVYAAVASKGSE